mmetsp:Transcript_30553/g.87622  ORF Transcript_30553/g.87622 Transcript_30553/m.87622 type:complete len:268 (-) Transcript_30553:1109-1912(-)
MSCTVVSLALPCGSLCWYFRSMRCNFNLSSSHSFELNFRGASEIASGSFSFSSGIGIGRRRNSRRGSLSRSMSARSKAESSPVVPSSNSSGRTCASGWTDWWATSSSDSLMKPCSAKPSNVSGVGEDFWTIARWSSVKWSPSLGFPNTAAQSLTAMMPVVSHAHFTCFLAAAAASSNLPERALLRISWSLKASAGGPLKTIRPSPRTTRRSAVPARRSRSCEFTTTTRVAFFIMPVTASSQAAWTTSLSTDATGSSRSATGAPSNTA